MSTNCRTRRVATKAVKGISDWTDVHDRFRQPETAEHHRQRPLSAAGDSSTGTAWWDDIQAQRARPGARGDRQHRAATGDAGARQDTSSSPTRSPPATAATPSPATAASSAPPSTPSPPAKEPTTSANPCWSRTPTSPRATPGVSPMPPIELLLGATGDRGCPRLPADTEVGQVRPWRRAIRS